jgi:drug/metabolite transporter (DMT)-like permease
MASEQSTSGLAALHTSVLLFGLAGLFGKLIETSPVVIVAGRTFFAACALCLLLIWNKSYRQTPAFKSSLPVLAFQGIMLALHWWSFFHAIQISSVAVGLLGFASFPMFVTLLEPVCFKEPYRWFDGVTALIVMIGLVTVAWPVDLSARQTAGVLWGILSGFLFALLALSNRQYVRRLSPIVIACVQNGVAFLALLPLAAFGNWKISWAQAGYLTILGVLCTALAHVLFINSLKSVKAQLAAVVAALEPVYGIVFALLLIGERPTFTVISGGILIVAATIAAVRFRAAAV